MPARSNPVAQGGTPGAGQFPKLRTVELPNELGGTDAGLAHLVALERLEAFNLNGTKVTAAGIVRFVEGRTKLQRPELTDVPLRDDDLANLQQLTDLRVMSLRATMVTGKGARRRRFPDTPGDHFAPTTGLTAAFADSSSFRHSAASSGLLVSSQSRTNRSKASASYRRASGVVSSHASGCGFKPS